MKNRNILVLALAIGLMIAATRQASAVGLPTFPARKCAPDAVLAGTICLDKFEATVWRVPDATGTNVALVKAIRLGHATRDDLTVAGATQLGVKGDDYAPCTDSGQNCVNDIFAVSLPDEIPSAHITWFQAQEACANAGKRLPSNAEWQVGANGRPDPGPDDQSVECNSATGSVSPTGSRGLCHSGRGAFDMVGNLAEWVADWVPLSTTCPSWGSFSDDDMCLAGANENGTGPGALLRGGFFSDGTGAGPLAVLDIEPFRALDFVGFRCAR